MGLSEVALMPSEPIMITDHRSTDYPSFTGSNHMRFVVAQRGARRNYAVPLQIQEAGMLEMFYTDLAGNAGWGRVLSRAATSLGVAGRFRNLLNRKIPDGVREKTRTFIIPEVQLGIRKLFGRSDPVSQFKYSAEHSRQIGESAARAGFRNADTLLVMLNEFGPLIRSAKDRGLTVVSDVYVQISTERILAEEQAAYPDWSDPLPDYTRMREQSREDNVLFSHVDFYLCPSEAVQRDLIENWGVASECTLLVPFGCDPAWMEIEQKTNPGRILFVGTAGIGKGIHYLAMAAEILSSRGLKYDFRVAGDVDEKVRNHPLSRNLNFLGRIPRVQIHQEFQTADVLVLPSLAEGSAGVTYEALGAGVPQVVTRAAGSVARDGIDGFVVPERDPERLADAIGSIVEDRTLRDGMALASRERAKTHTWAHYRARLTAALRSAEE